MLQRFHCTWVLVVLAATFVTAAALEQQPPSAPAEQTQNYTVFLATRPIGQESVAVERQADGWVVRGSNRLGPPLDVVTRTAEVHYDSAWRPSRMSIEGTLRGQSAAINTTFANGQASSEISIAGTQSTKTDAVTADAIVLTNTFLGSYAALARRLGGVTSGATVRVYIAPQVEVVVRVSGVFAERVETPRQVIAATRYALVFSNPPPQGDLDVNVWTDIDGGMLRINVPAQMLEIAREDIASAATRTTAFSLPGDEMVRIPAAGFGLAATVTKPANTTGQLPALILIGGSGPTDRDGFVAGIPILGQIAGDLVDAGFVVVRYDKRGVGQSGGRPETSTVADYAEDVRAIVTWLEKQRKDVDKKRIGIVGHSEGAWVALTTAARDKRVAAIALIAAPSSRGSELVLEQQRHLLGRMNATEAEKQAKIDLQKKIHAAVLQGGTWEGVPDDIRRSASSPWFQSFLAFDPATVMKNVRQPILILQGELDTQVPPHHADRLSELARARKRKVTVDVVKVPKMNHLLVSAQTGEVDEYTMLAEKKVSSIATRAIADWMARTLGFAKSTAHRSTATVYSPQLKGFLGPWTVDRRLWTARGG